MMAGEWIKIEKATATKKEILRLSSILQIHPDHALGLCVRFWIWVDDNQSTPNVDGVSESLVDALVNRNGFSQAMIDIGWLARGNGGLLIPNFDRHLSKGSKTRALTARRVAKHTNAKNNDQLTVGALAEEEKIRRREDKKELHTHAREDVSEIRTEIGDAKTFQATSKVFDALYALFPPRMQTGPEKAYVAWLESVCRIVETKGKTREEVETYIESRVKKFSQSPKALSSDFLWSAENFFANGIFNASDESWGYGAKVDRHQEPKIKVNPLPDKVKR